MVLTESYLSSSDEKGLFEALSRISGVEAGELKKRYIKRKINPDLLKGVRVYFFVYPEGILAFTVSPITGQSDIRRTCFTIKFSRFCL